MDLMLFCAAAAILAVLIFIAGHHFGAATVRAALAPIGTDAEKLLEDLKELVKKHDATSATPVVSQAGPQVKVIPLPPAAS